MITLGYEDFNNIYFDICNFSIDMSYNPYLYTNGLYLDNMDSMEIIVSKYTKTFLKNILRKYKIKLSELKNESIKIYLKLNN